MSDAQLIQAFLRFCQFNEGLSSNSIQAYRRDLSLFATWLASQNLTLLQVTLADLDPYLASLFDQGHKNSSIARKISSLKRFYHYCLMQDYVSASPTEFLSAPKVAQKIPQVLSESQVEALLQTPDLTTPLGLRDKAVLELMYATGLRVSEVVNLSVEQIHFAVGVVQVMGKGNKERLVPLGQWALEAIEAYLNRARPLLLKQATSSVLFISQHSRRMTRQTLWHRIKRWAMIAGLPETLSPHGLRHAFATHLVNHGADLRSVQLLLGHEDLSTTQIYTHVAQARLQKLHQAHHPRG